MATDPDLVQHILDQAGLGERLTGRKMFGEYGFHLDGKFIAAACDGSFFIKPTPALDEHGLELPMRPPYPGAKDYAVADDLVDDPAGLQRLLLDTAAHLPEPKPTKAHRDREARTSRRTRSP